jgi:ATP-dependent Zn protease
VLLVHVFAATKIKRARTSRLRAAKKCLANELQKFSAAKQDPEEDTKDTEGGTKTADTTTDTTTTDATTAGNTNDWFKSSTNRDTGQHFSRPSVFVLFIVLFVIITKKKRHRGAFA